MVTTMAKKVYESDGFVGIVGEDGNLPPTEWMR
jgi:hypothetical protein